MDPLALLAVKAAALRKMANGKGRPEPYRSFADLAAGPEAKRLPPEPFTGVRAGETGIGVPVGVANDARPLTAAELKALDEPAAKAFSSSTPRTAGPTIGGKPSALGKIFSSRGGKAGLGGLGLLGLGGLGAHLLSGPSPQPGGIGAAAAPASALPPAPAAPALTNQREAIRKSVAQKMRGAAGDFWRRMQQKYTQRPQEVL